MGWFNKNDAEDENENENDLGDASGLVELLTKESEPSKFTNEQKLEMIMNLLRSTMDSQQLNHTKREVKIILES